MDAALKRSRSEEPVELLQSARDLEEEEEEGTEQELEEEEEVDPRIQVGRVGSPGTPIREGRRGCRRLRLQPPRSPGASGPGWGWRRRRSGGKRRGSERSGSLGSSGGCRAPVDAA